LSEYQKTMGGAGIRKKEKVGGLAGDKKTVKREKGMARDTQRTSAASRHRKGCPLGCALPQKTGGKKYHSLEESETQKGTGGDFQIVVEKKIQREREEKQQEQEGDWEGKWWSNWLLQVEGGGRLPGGKGRWKRIDSFYSLRTQNTPARREGPKGVPLPRPEPSPVEARSSES